MHSQENISIKQNSGFSLIELLVVIFILGILATLIVSNLQSARQRARDASKKSELTNLKTALRLYYNDYQKYPDQDFGIYLPACGADGATRCPVCSSADFAAGGVDGCQTIYMKDLTESGSTYFFKYYNCDDDDFRLKVALENYSDSVITDSQARCSTSCGAQTLVFAENEYVICAD